MPTPIILDVDTGYDDAVAILIAAGHPEIELLGVTTVAGNAPLAVTTDNTLRTLDAAGYTDIPVIAGAYRPLLRELGGSPGIPTATMQGWPIRRLTRLACPTSTVSPPLLSSGHITWT